MGLDLPLPPPSLDGKGEEPRGEGEEEPLSEEDFRFDLFAWSSSLSPFCCWERPSIVRPPRTGAALSLRAEEVEFEDPMLPSLQAWSTGERVMEERVRGRVSPRLDVSVVRRSTEV